ncbi:hypothetical protein LCGC14_2241250, partial [marine sediment metagenome]
MDREFGAGYDPVVSADNDAFRAALGSGTWTNTAHRFVQWFKAAGVGVTSVGRRSLSPTGLLFDQTYRWWLFWIHFDGTLITNQRIAILIMGGRTIAIEQDTDTSTYKIALGSFAGDVWTGIGVSSRTYSVHDNLLMRFQTDGSRHKLWIEDIDDGTPSLDLEIDVADALEAVSPDFDLRNGHGAVNALASGQDVYWRRMQAWQSNSESDRPDIQRQGASQVFFQVMHPNADTAEDDFSKHGGPPSPDEKWNYWNDMAAVDETEYLLADSSADRQQVSALPACASAHNGTVGGVMWHLRCRAATSAKIAVAFARIKDDGGSASEVELPNEASGAYDAKAAGFRDPPDGGSWEDFIHTDSIFNSPSASQQLS